MKKGKAIGVHEIFEAQIRRLILGLADQEIKKGHGFLYDGGPLYADDVAEIATPSILCIAHDLSQRLGLKGFGYRFSIAEPNPVFPIHAVPVGESPKFFEVAPFVTEVFEGEVRDCRMDMALLFEAAAKLVHPEFNLVTHTNYSAPNVGRSFGFSSPTGMHGLVQ